MDVKEITPIHSSQSAVADIVYAIGKVDLKIVVTQMGSSIFATPLFRPIWSQSPSKSFIKKLNKTLGIKKKK